MTDSAAAAGTVLVTGGTGFVGPRVVAALRDRDLPVRALARRPAREEALRALGVELVEGDVTKPETLGPALAGADTVVHLVSIIQGKPKDFDRIMCEGTRNVVAAAREAGVRRVVLMSALGLTEETAETIPYFRCKQQMEEAVSTSGLFVRSSSAVPAWVEVGSSYSPDSILRFSSL